MSRPKTLAEVFEPDPCDMGALLKAAVEAAGLNPHQVAVRSGMAPPNVYRALSNPNTRPEAARRILAAVGMRLNVTKVAQ